jgi:ADP-heptose:LPS heptosyltransferase
MGDVALTIPVIRAFSRKYPDAEIVMVTRKAFEPFFNSIPSVKLFFPDFRRRHKGLPGIIRLYNDLRYLYTFDHIIDLHDVLRSKVLRFLFRLSGVKVSVIDKGRREKKALISGKKKTYLKHTVERYCDVFLKAGVPVEPLKENCILPDAEALKKTDVQVDKHIINIGVAPFAKHQLKMWPVDYMMKLLAIVSHNHKCMFWFFGGDEDLPQLRELKKLVAGSFITTGVLNLKEELALMSKLSFMISMDSSNMHMAALSGTKVISIWGGTDPMAGFGPWMQPDKYSIRIPVEELDCRPCTIYGKGKTKRNFECMRRLTPELVYERMIRLGVFD